MVGPYSNGDGAPVSYTINALKRWSCDDRALPAIDQIKAIHVYDFDNTLFMSPLPNQNIWHGPCAGRLGNQDAFINGGWWHDVGILSATGEGLEIEESRAWAGWWNEKIVQLVQLSMQQKDALTVLLTGRGEAKFAELLKKICNSRKLEFDMFCLKPLVSPSNQRFRTTMDFKQELLKAILYTYREADEFVIYEDRPKHVKGFRTFLSSFNAQLSEPDCPIPRKPLAHEVVEVTELVASLNPIIETAEVQRMVNDHNLIIRSGNAPASAVPLQLIKSVSFTAYQISPVDSKRLLELVVIPPNDRKRIRTLANSIFISTGALKPDNLRRYGGLGTAVRFQVVKVAAYEDRLWAARVEPVQSSAQSRNGLGRTETVVLAVRQGTQPHESNRIKDWKSVPKEKMFQFEAVLGEKFMLSLEREQDPNLPSAKAPRRNIDQRSAGQVTEDDYNPVLISPGQNRIPDQPRSNASQRDRRQDGPYRGGSRDRGRGNSRRGDSRGRGSFSHRGNARGRGRGGYPSYRSLDDVDDRSYQSRVGYTDHDAQGGARADKDTGMYNAY